MRFICGKTQDERQQMGTRAFDRVVSDVQLKHSIQSAGPPGRARRLHQKLTGCVCGGPSYAQRDVAFFWGILGAQRGKVPAATAQTDKASFH